MGVLVDIQKISDDSAALATLNGQLVTAQATVTALQGQIDGAGGTVTTDDLQLSNDLQALPRPVFVVDTASGMANVYAYSPNPPGFTITAVDPAT